MTARPGCRLRAPRCMLVGQCPLARSILPSAPLGLAHYALRARARPRGLRLAGLAARSALPPLQRPHPPRCSSYGKRRRRARRARRPFGAAAGQCDGARLRAAPAAPGSGRARRRHGAADRAPVADTSAGRRSDLQMRSSAGGGDAVLLDRELAGRLERQPGHQVALVG